MRTDLKIICVYVGSLGIVVAGAVLGLVVGNYQQRLAKQAKQNALYESSLLSELQIAVLYNRPTKQLAPYTQDLARFRAESQSLLVRLRDIESFVQANRVPQRETTLPGLKEFLIEYEDTIADFIGATDSFIQRTQPLVATPAGEQKAQKEIVSLVKSPEFVAFIEGPDHMAVLHQQALQREAEAAEYLAQAEILRTRIILICLSFAILISIGLLIYLRRLQRKASQDALTKIPNRSALLAEGQYLLRKTKAQSQFAVMMIDIDNFKRINDTYGHACGDYVLQMVAQKLQGNLSQGDRIGRLGGEEFAAIFATFSPDQGKYLPDAMIHQVAESPILYEHHQIRTTVSGGVALYDPHDNDFLSILKRADAALYQAKRSGGNQVEWAK